MQKLGEESSLDVCQLMYNVLGKWSCRELLDVKTGTFTHTRRLTFYPNLSVFHGKQMSGSEFSFAVYRQLQRPLYSLLHLDTVETILIKYHIGHLATYQVFVLAFKMLCGLGTLLTLQSQEF